MEKESPTCQNYICFSHFDNVLNMFIHFCVIFPIANRSEDTSAFCCILAAPQQFLDITSTGELGGGLIVQHGYNTLISPAKMGKNCWINQGVSIGHRTKVGQPVIGDNVRIAAGALVLGAIKIGRGATVAPGAVVMKHVPPYAIVTGNPAKIIGFNMTPEEVVEFEAKEYPEEERIPLIKLQKNYEKHYINKREEIAEFLS